MTPALAVVLASLVAVTPPDRWGDGCVAWVESRGATCGKDVMFGFLCARHVKVAQRRWEKEGAERVRQARQRAQRREEKMHVWVDELERVDAEIARRTAPLTTDRAFSGGVGTPQHRKHLLRQFSDSNVQRVGELARRRRTLEILIGEQP